MCLFKITIQKNNQLSFVMPCTIRKQCKFEENVNFEQNFNIENVNEKDEDEADSLEVFLSTFRDINPYPKDIKKNFKISVDIKYVSTSEKLREKELELSTIVAMCELKRLQHMCIKKN